MKVLLVQGEYPASHQWTLGAIYWEVASSPCAGLGARQPRQCSAAGMPFRLQAVTHPVTGPAKARSRVVVSMGGAPAAARKLGLLIRLWWVRNGGTVLRRVSLPR